MRNKTLRSKVKCHTITSSELLWKLLRMRSLGNNALCVDPTPFLHRVSFHTHSLSFSLTCSYQLIPHYFYYYYYYHHHHRNPIMISAFDGMKRRCLHAAYKFIFIWMEKYTTEKVSERKVSVDIKKIFKKSYLIFSIEMRWVHWSGMLVFSLEKKEKSFTTSKITWKLSKSDGTETGTRQRKKTHANQAFVRLPVNWWCC